MLGDQIKRIIKREIIVNNHYKLKQLPKTMPKTTGKFSIEIQDYEIRSKSDARPISLALKKLKCLKHFNIKFNDTRSDILLKQVYPSFKRHRSLSTLDLSSETSLFSGKSIEADLENLFFYVRNSKSLSCISFHFGAYAASLGRNTLEILSQGLIKLRSLIKLNFDFACCNKIDANALKSFISLRWRNLAHLSSLRLNFFGNERTFGDEELNVLSSTLKHIPVLSSLALDLGFCQMLSDKGLESLSYNLQEKISLRCLDLDLSSPEITENGLQCLTSWIKKLEDLRVLSVRFGSHITFAEEQSFSSSFNQLKNLSTLKLDFYQCFRLGEDGIKLLSAVISSFKTLTTLDLNFVHCSLISEEGFDALASSLGTLNKLSTLKFGGTNYNLGDNAMEKLSLSLTNLKLLSSLELNFSRCSELGNKGLQYLIGGLKTMKELKRFALSIYRSEKISDEGIVPLFSSFGQLENLTSLHLAFVDCFIPGEESLMALASSLSKLQSLVDVSFESIRSLKIEERGLKSLSEGMQSLKPLRSLTLDLGSTEGFDDNCIRSLAQCIKGLDSLAVLTLNFLKKEDTSEEGINFLFNEIAQLRFLSELNVKFIQQDDPLMMKWLPRMHKNVKITTKPTDFW